jgi:quercetin dioxygenase-like cupin family protein
MIAERDSGGLLSFTGSIEYQDGAVVSRTILKHDSGSVTLFAFDAGQGLSEHTTPHEALVQIVEGEAEITISGRTHRVKQGEMIRMPAGEPHAVRAATRFKMILTMIRN